VTRAIFLLLVAVVAVAGHDLTYLLVHGPAFVGAALERSGHDAHWASAASTVAVTLLLTLGVVAFRLRSLRRTLRAAGTAPSVSGRPSTTAVLTLALRLTAAALATFVVQEAAESLAIGRGFTGLGIVAGAGWLSIPLFGLVALLVAAASALLTTRLRVMAAAAARVRRPRPRRAGQRPLRPAHALPAPSVAWIQPVLGRAPPAGP
jgi:hypothetical protein